MLLDYDGRDMTALSLEQSSLFSLSQDSIKRIQTDFPDIYQEMLETALNRFKYQQLILANNMRKYLSMAVDGHNDEFGIEETDEVTDFEVYSH